MEHKGGGMKIYYIMACGECHHCILVWGPVYHCIEADKQIPNYAEIPDFCPLEDAEEEGE